MSNGRNTNTCLAYMYIGSHFSLHSNIIMIIIIIIIINFYDSYILGNLSPEAQQNRISKHNREQGRAKSLSERGTTEDLWWKCNFE